MGETGGPIYENLRCDKQRRFFLSLCAKETLIFLTSVRSAVLVLVIAAALLGRRRKGHDKSHLGHMTKITKME